MDNKQIHEAEKEILKVYLDICGRFNLKYYILGGTLLGAVRHKGFIPWDDDIDIGMPRGDYEKFIEIFSGLENNNYRLKYFRYNNNQDYPIKLENPKLTISDYSTGKQKKRHPWIDIFPLDGLPQNKLILAVHKYKLLSARALLKISQLSSNVSIDNPYRTNIEKIVFYTAKYLHIEYLLNEKKCMDKIDNLLKKYTYNQAKYIINFMGAYKFKEMFQKSIYEDSSKYAFEGILLNGPTDFDKVLSQLYGDYMEIPDQSIRNKHSIKVERG